MGSLIDLTGRTFNSLLVLSRNGTSDYGQPLWLCRCSCGNELLVTGSNIRNKQKSCRECFLKRNVSHGLSETKEYHSWEAMKSRCYNENNESYSYYGGRGITVCNRWLDSFENFINDMGEAPKKHSLDRIDPEKEYSPKNCRWANAKEQIRNRRKTKMAVIDSVSKPMAEWAEIYGIKLKTAIKRIERGWSIKDSFCIKTLKYSERYKKSA